MKKWLYFLYPFTCVIGAVILAMYGKLGMEYAAICTGVGAAYHYGGAKSAPHQDN